MSHLPNREGETANGNLRNWWKYVADFDNAVASLARADLEVSGIDFTSPPTAGVLTTAVARLVNVGAASSGVFNVKWFLDGVEVGYGGHLSLAPGEVSNDNIRFDWVPTPGVHSLRFDADADNQVAELNEQNNSATVTARVLADLEARGIIFTSRVREGVRTTAVAVLANVGRAPSGVFNVKWFLDGAQVGYGGHVSLAPGEISNDNIRFDWTPTRGTHTLRFEADVDDQVPELNEGNNSATVTVRVLADLEVGRITFSSPPTVGAWTGVEARLANVGRAPSGSFKVRWWVDGQEHLTVTYPNGLDPGQRTLDGFNWTPTAGVHTLRFEADVDDQVPELNEGNNSATVTVRVLADLEARGIIFTSSVREGVRTTAVAVLANVGRAPSGVFNVKWFLDGAQVGYGGHVSLAPGEISNDNIRFDWTPTSGTHTLRFQADVDHQVPELNEGNNSATVTVRVLADLEVSGITFTSTPRVGVRTTAVARLANVGRASSGVFNVKWFLDGVQVGYGSHASLAPGEVSTGNVRFGWTPTPGRHRLRFQADVDNQVRELNERNNGATVTVQVR
jgi:subtilase family serine protease